MARDNVLMSCAVMSLFLMTMTIGMYSKRFRDASPSVTHIGALRSYNLALPHSAAAAYSVIKKQENELPNSEFGSETIEEWRKRLHDRRKLREERLNERETSRKELEKELKRIEERQKRREERRKYIEKQDRTKRLEARRHQPATCNCRIEIREKKGTCYMYTNKGNSFCEKRDCSARYVCSTRRTGVTCMRRYTVKKIVPVGLGKCETKMSGGVIYVPYTAK